MSRGVDYRKVKPAKKRGRPRKRQPQAPVRWELVCLLTLGSGRMAIVDDPATRGLAYSHWREAEAAARVAAENAIRRGWPHAIRYEVVAA